MLATAFEPQNGHGSRLGAALVVSVMAVLHGELHFFQGRNLLSQAGYLLCACSLGSGDGSFGLFAVLILVQLAATGAAAFRIYNKQKKD